MSDIAVAVLYIALLILQLIGLTLSGLQNRAYRKLRRQIRLDGIRSSVEWGSMYRSLGYPIPNRYLNDSSYQGRAFVKGYITKGKRMAREGK